MFTEEYPPLTFVYEVTDNGVEWRSLGVLDKDSALQILRARPPAVLRARLREIHSGKTKEVPTVPRDVTTLLRDIDSKYNELVSRRIPVGSAKQLYVTLYKFVDACDWVSVRKVGGEVMFRLKVRGLN